MCWRKRERERKRVNLTSRVGHMVEFVAVYFNLLQCGSDVWLNVLQCVWREGEKETSVYRERKRLQCTGSVVYFNALQGVAVCYSCSVSELQRIAVCCSVLQ